MARPLRYPDTLQLTLPPGTLERIRRVVGVDGVLAEAGRELILEALERKERPNE